MKVYLGCMVQQTWPKVWFWGDKQIISYEFFTEFFANFFVIFFLSVCATYPNYKKIGQKLSVPQLNDTFMLKISKSVQNQKNAYISGLSGPNPKPFVVVNPFGSRVSIMPKWFESLTTPIPVSGHPCQKSALKSTQHFLMLYY